MNRVTDTGQYVIVDEPRPTILGRFAIPPVVPFFLATIIIWPWGFFTLILNSIALDGHAKKIEIWFSLTALVAIIVLRLCADILIDSNILPRSALPYLKVFIFAQSFWFAFKIFRSQEMTYRVRKNFRSQWQHR